MDLLGLMGLLLLVGCCRCLGRGGEKRPDGVNRACGLREPSLAGRNRLRLICFRRRKKRSVGYLQRSIEDTMSNTSSSSPRVLTRGHTAGGGFQAPPSSETIHV